MNNKIKKVLESKEFKILIFILGIIIVIFWIFEIGFYSGLRRATFGRDWGNHYFENFGPRQGRGNIPMMNMMREEFPNSNGAIGKIIKIELPLITVLDRDNVEKVVLIDDKAIVIKQKQEIKSTELRMDDFIVTIGSPNSQGQIEAKFIRIMPLPPELPNNNLKK